MAEGLVGFLIGVTITIFIVINISTYSLRQEHKTIESCRKYAHPEQAEECKYYIVMPAQ